MSDINTIECSDIYEWFLQTEDFLLHAIQLLDINELYIQYFKWF